MSTQANNPGSSSSSETKNSTQQKNVNAGEGTQVNQLQATQVLVGEDLNRNITKFGDKVSNAGFWEALYTTEMEAHLFNNLTI